ncbi:hypothetical protein EYF80_048982 [Liparis tanakae]|uniref:Uncharacterized protein n=1 Tax=Liparis tanakae TaxID=230148 RepID=A0A4Z2FHZ6_9TELE|nr:hypothetical protein EYF80_048982 [Liparis tanakae]
MCEVVGVLVRGGQLAPRMGQCVRDESSFEWLEEYRPDDLSSDAPAAPRQRGHDGYIIHVTPRALLHAHSSALRGGDGSGVLRTHEDEGPEDARGRGS